MKSTTIASEKTRPFYVKLKRSPMADWFIPEIIKNTKIKKQKLPKTSLKGEFQIKRFGYFHKHAWYFFENDDVTGWLPLKSVRNNYRRLAVEPVTSDNHQVVASYLAVAKMMLNYAGAPVSDTEMNDLFELSVDEVPLPADFFTVIVDQIGSFKNLSGKKLRRLRSHLRRERPIMMWLGSNNSHPQTAILLTGFNKKVFFYLDPSTGNVHAITKKALLKRWKAARHLAISY
ncbi:hypothetical protein [Nicoliella lavandulae]|uniref:Peptidase C39-like domain-containing protein n=1 Tax=Nicoliella lavandulae TaxID=3082954 RepID=A0ABU8SKA3_9LACO